MSTGKYELLIKWPSGQSTLSGEISDQQYGEICLVLSPDQCRAQSVPDEFEEIGVIDESDDGVFVDLHDDQSFKLGQKVYAAAPSAQQKESGDE